MKALSVSDRRNLSRFVCYQGYYNIGARDLEREIVPLAVDQNVGITAWSPLAAWFPDGQVPARRGPTEGSRLSQRTPSETTPLTDEEQAYDIVDEMARIAADHDATVAQVALNWVLAKPGITSAVVGATKPHQLADNLQAMEWTLTEDELTRLDKVSETTAPYPYWHIGREGSDRKLPGDVYPA